MKNHAADPEIGLLKKLISKLYGRATAMPQAQELNCSQPKKVLVSDPGNKVSPKSGLPTQNNIDSGI